ncbi:hypothetical protein FJZ20_01400 [Candidatus Pacearchaeota archaeon]|nr:hypothetical protein [Candidatus Pacearchaeota archaeon]
MKKRLLAFLAPFLMIKLVSAQFFGSYGGSFSIVSFLDSIGAENITFLALFIIFFAVIFYSLSRLFKDPYGQPNKPIAGILAFAISALISYGIYRSGFDLTSLLYGWGIDTSFLYPLFSIAILLFAGLMIKYVGFGMFLMLLGAFFLYIALFTDIVYEKTLVGIIGIVSAVLGFVIWRRKAARRRLEQWGVNAFQKIKSKPKWIIILVGVLMILAGFKFGVSILIVIGFILGLIGFFFNKSRRRGLPPPDPSPNLYNAQRAAQARRERETEARINRIGQRYSRRERRFR